MDILICNKCFAPIYRGKQPYNITQCGHIFCPDCLQQAEKQCSQCEYIGAMSLPLKEPLVPKVAPFFTPLADILEQLIKVDTFRSNQLKITIQRFRELDNKYEIMKMHYWAIRRNMKLLTEENYKLKAENEKLDKKLLFAEMQGSASRSTRAMKTPTDSGIFMHPLSTGYSAESVNVTPVPSTILRKHCQNSDDFRIPNNRKPPGSVNCLTRQTRHNYNFRL